VCLVTGLLNRPTDRTHPNSHPHQTKQFPSALSPDGRLLCLATERRSLACYRLSSSTKSTNRDDPGAFFIDFDEEEVEDLIPPVPVAITSLQVRCLGVYVPSRGDGTGVLPGTLGFP
jgi:hypothetical protein